VKIRVRELARRLSIMSGTTVTVVDVVTLGKAVGLPLNPTTSALQEPHLKRLLEPMWGDDYPSFGVVSTRPARCCRRRAR
jgi:hypothetical protein